MGAARIPRRALGTTGLEVSVLGFGASPLGGVFEDIDEDKGVQAVHEAFKLGINFFDTSPFYGATRSETVEPFATHKLGITSKQHAMYALDENVHVLGRALKELPREEFVLSTKVGRYGQENFDFSADRVTASITESLQRLQVPYIDIIQCHDIEFGNLDQVINETLPALHELKKKGLVKFIGITGLPLRIFPYVLDKVGPGTVDVVLSYCHYSLNDTSLESIIPYLKEKNVGIISASPLSMGLLTKQGPPGWHPAPPAVKEACKAGAEHAASRGTDISKLALAHAVRNPDIATTLVGMATPEIVETNVKIVLEALAAEQTAAAKLDAEVAEEVARLLQPIKDTTWPSGKPDNN